MISETIIRSFFGEALSFAETSEKVHQELLPRLVSYYTLHGHIVLALGEAVAYIYDNRLPEHHDIYNLPGNHYLILPVLKAFPKDVLLEALHDAKKDNLDLRTGDGQNFLQEVTAAVKHVHAFLLKYHQSRRKFGAERPEPEFPCFEELQKFHECSRKPAHASKSEAEAHRNTGQVAYLCTHCSQWHKGHPSLMPELSRDDQERKYRRTWRRYHDI